MPIIYLLSSFRTWRLGVLAFIPYTILAVIAHHQIVHSLRNLGVAPGDLLLAHSSYKSFGGVEGGPPAVAQALIDAVSPAGTAMVPTFTFGQGIYDPAKTLSLTGAICDAFCQLPNAKRSLQPTHAFAAVGPLAQDLLANHESVHPFGIGSPIHKFYEYNGWILLIGVDHRRSSIIHVAEELASLPHINRTRVASSMVNGEVEEKIVRRPGCSEGYNKIDPLLRQRNQIRETTVGQSHFLLMRSRDIVTAALDMLAQDPLALLCDSADCVRCNWARQGVPLV